MPFGAITLATTTGDPNVVRNLSNLGYEIVNWIQILAVPATAIALGIGGITHIFGGKNGFEKAKAWYIGGAVGLIVALGATSIANFLKGKISF